MPAFCAGDACPTIMTNTRETCQSVNLRGRRQEVQGLGLAVHGSSLLQAAWVHSSASSVAVSLATPRSQTEESSLRVLNPGQGPPSYPRSLLYDDVS